MDPKEPLERDSRGSTVYILRTGGKAEVALLWYITTSPGSTGREGAVVSTLTSTDRGKSDRVRKFSCPFLLNEVP